MSVAYATRSTQPNTSVAKDAIELIRRKDIPGNSFVFKVRKGSDTWRRESDNLIREIRSASLVNVSPVARPAYAATEVALRSLESW